MNKSGLVIPKEKIRAFCQRWDVVEFALFGSALSPEFKPDSDVDVLVTFQPQAQIGLFELAQMQIELESLFRRPVDLVEKASLRNPYRRHEILQTAQVI